MKWSRLLACCIGLWAATAVAAPPIPPPPPPPPPPPGGSPIRLLEDVKNTKHNLSSTPSTASRNVFTTATSEICVFCHTPHGASPETLPLGAPLWNRHLSTASYTLYDNTWSFSFEGQLNTGAPTGFSRLCLSCHDGTIAIGSVLNAPGSGGYEQQIPITVGAGPGGTMPPGPGGELTGDTRRLGTNLRNDHPISFVFDSTLVSTKDPEFVNPGPFPARPSQEPLYPAGIGPLRRYAGNNPAVYDSVQCVSCHNPHAVTYPKFLRAPIQDCSKAANPCPGTGFSANSLGQQLICFFCHNKNVPSGNSYDSSTHAVSQARHAQYPPSTLYPSNPGYDFDGLHNVGQASCRNCHDPHTTQGAIRLHREGVDTPGGGDAIENTCYLCHSPNAAGPGIVQPTPFGQPSLPAGTNTGFLAGFGTRIAPDIYSQFAKDRNLGVNSPCDQDQINAPAKPIASAQTDCGSGMNLKLDDGIGAIRAHQPFFVKLPKEGVEFNYPPPSIVGNEDTDPLNPAYGQPDDQAHRHIECVDCHNPHQVTNPNLGGLNTAGRIKGMKGITHNDKVIGIETTETGCDPGPCAREPYVYEVCFRCHGNSVPELFKGDDFNFSAGRIWRSNPQPGTLASEPNLSYQGFSNKRLEFSPSNGVANLTSSNMSSTATNPQGGQYEIGPLVAGIPEPGGDIDPQSPQSDQRRRLGPGMHKAYHPVVAAGRNGSVQLFNQLKEAFGLTAVSDLTSLTIQCSDCHNNDYYNRFADLGARASAVFQISPNGNGSPPWYKSGPLTESSLRTSLHATDRAPGFAISYTNPTTGRVAQPIGPHGSNFIRILRARYNTDIANPARNFQADGFNADHFNNFLLCFQCHDRRAFDPNWPTPALAEPGNTGLTNFYGNPATPAGLGIGGKLAAFNLAWSSNLHMYHLSRTGAYCHECHNNVHSNVQAPNTIFGGGAGAVVGTDCSVPSAGCVGLPPDAEDGITDGISDTHLLNFAPGGPTAYSGEQRPDPFSQHFANAGVEGVTAPNPVWYFDGTAAPARFRCNLRCHGVVMATCHYRALDMPALTDANVMVGNEAGGDPTAWCSGGIAQAACSQAPEGTGC